MRLLSVLTALSLVGAFAIVALLPGATTLAGLVAMLDHQWLVVAERASHGQVASWVWRNLAMPLLARPAWIFPTATGLVLGGIAVSLAWRAPPARRR